MNKTSHVSTIDPLFKETRMNLDNTSNFFSGKDVKLKPLVPKEKKEKKEPVIDNEEIEEEIDSNEEVQLTEEETTELAGLESIINRFGSVITSQDAYNAPQEDFDVSGNESIYNKIGSILSSLISFLKDIGRWIYNFFNNKIAKLDTRILYLKQKRKINGIVEGEIKYPATVRRLVIPSRLSTNPNWTIGAIEDLAQFYKLSISGHKVLKDVLPGINIVSSDFDTVKLNTLDELGKTMTSGTTRNGIYQSKILPGNKIFNIQQPDKSKGIDGRLFFTDSSGGTRLPSEVFLNSSSLIDELLKVMDKTRSLIMEDQKHMYQLIMNFEKQAKAFMAPIEEINMAHRVKHIFTWLTTLNKQLVTTTLQYTLLTLEGGLDMVNAGIRNDR